jgi:penicillin amidase
MLAVQLDDRALFLKRWRDLLLRILTPEAVVSHPPRQEFRRLVAETWTGRASVISAGYRLVRAFRLNLRDEVYGWLTASCLQVDPEFDFREIGQFEGPLWQMINQRPAHLLVPHFATWEDALLAVVDSTAARATQDEQPLAAYTWGQRNTTDITHPLSRAVPVLSRWLDMPARQLPGGSHMPRVQHPRFGASERMVVSPGRESDGIMHMPCGQSGHPLSPYYGAGHDAWAEGRPTPLLAGKAKWVLTLQPIRE